MIISREDDVNWKLREELFRFLYYYLEGRRKKERMKCSIIILLLLGVIGTVYAGSHSAAEIFNGAFFFVNASYVFILFYYNFYLFSYYLFSLYFIHAEQ